jgi:hypothetical protein
MLFPSCTDLVHLQHLIAAVVDDVIAISPVVGGSKGREVVE